MKKTACLLALAFCACSSSDTQPEATADEFIVDCAGTDAGTGVTSDENLAAFINAEASNRVTTDPCKSPEIVSPLGGAKLSVQTPPSFSFNDVRGNGCVPTPIRPRTGLRKVPRQQPGYSRMAEALLMRVSGEAHAHCGAITGPNYYFKVMPQNGTAPLYTAMLSVTNFTPDAAKWQKALSGRNGQTVTVIIERADFFKGDINGPVGVTQATFPVGP
jgi:hypothetical protein